MFILSLLAKWSSILCTGSRPPPCSAFSLTMIDHHRAVLFGGVQAGQHSSDAFILELTTMVTADNYFITIL